MTVIFMGTPAFAAVQLQGLIEAGCDIGLVVSRPDKKGNRNKVEVPPVKQLALEAGLPLAQPDTIKGNEGFFALLAAKKPDLIVVSAYGRILPEEILHLPTLACINVHASLLPAWRGPSPIQAAILAGDKETGVTIMEMEAGLDTGPCLLSETVEIGDRDYPALAERLALCGKNLLLRVLPLLQKGEAVRHPQDPSQATYSQMIRKQDGKIDFCREKAHDIIRKQRAFTPWPGIYCSYKGKTLKILQAEALPETGAPGKPGAEAGQVLAASDAGIDVQCLQDILRIKAVQVAGKKKTDAASFLRGHKLLPGDRLT